MVDDQPAKLLSYEVILKELDENLIKAHSGREALDQLLRNGYRRRADGRQHAGTRRFRVGRHDSAAPTVSKDRHHFYFRGASHRFGPLKAYQRGAVDYISVPIIPELLRAKVSVFADLHRKTRQMEMLNGELRSLSARLIATQDEERRRIARDLHDSVGQLVATLSMNNGLALMEAE